MYQDERGRWIAEVSVGYDARGKRVRRKRVAASKTGALQFLKEMNRDLEAGLGHDANTVTVAHSLDRLLDVMKKRNLQPRTLENYEWAVGHLRRGLGRHRLRGLTPMQVEAFLEQARDSCGLGSSSLGRLRLVLRQSITEAEKLGWVARNVAALAELPKATSKEATCLSKAEAMALIHAASGGPMHAYVVVGLSAGLRPGELLGLRWQDLALDDEIPVLNVRHCLTLGTSGLCLGEPKTKQSRRCVPLSAMAANTLRAHRKRQLLARFELGPDWDDKDLVFPNGLGGFADHSNVRRELAKLCRAAGIQEVPPYTMRHTALTLLSADDMPAERIADMAGHADTRMLLTVYRHRNQLPVNDAGVRMDRMLGQTGSDG